MSDQPTRIMPEMDEAYPWRWVARVYVDPMKSETPTQ